MRYTICYYVYILYMWNFKINLLNLTYLHVRVILYDLKESINSFPIFVVTTIVYNCMPIKNSIRFVAYECGN